MLTRLHRGGALVALMSICFMIAASCSETAEGPTQSLEPESRRSVQMRHVAQEEVYSVRNASVFSEVMSDPDVEAAISFLEAEGSSWVDTNSLIFIEEIWGWPLSPSAALDRPLIEGPAGRHEELLRADTIIWLSFATAIVDPANHTAILHGRRDGERGTIILELNVAEVPYAIREGKMVNQVFTSYDPNTQGFWACWAGTAAMAGTYCGLTNGCWAKCAGPLVAAGGVGCGVQALLE